MFDLSGAEWRKSSRSASGGECVEVALNLRDVTAIRDSKDPGGAALVVRDEAWREFLSRVKAGF
ncbi:DUF397 domain-containing protein [Saccharopolyspora flava]|uniref:DUF397 domain-containing protein n=1 Tax=Saccharopolyspora flava TaxID=95161 RepID=A0A1I6P241_9PSEU|nr:DUF397 domain-containing protein [Saccharopolyspora flava]SFS34259.1 protein of unknown function [Saccharopolyspora flava]